jgi:dipeptidyl aminopeptidase/acylaminoacyl peptidase
MMHRRLFACVIVFGLATLVRGQERVTGANYPLAQKFNNQFVSQHVQIASVTPTWIGNTDVFWYSTRNATGTKYWKVDPNKKEKTPLFDHVALAAALSEATKRPIDAETLRLDNLSVSSDSKKLTLTANGTRYEYELETNRLKSLGKAPPSGPGGPMTSEQIERLRQQLGDERVNEMLRGLGKTDQKKDDEDEKQDDTTSKTQTKQPGKGGIQTGYKNYSPDKKQYVYVYKHNLYLVQEGQSEDQARQLTSDGQENYSFAGGGFGGGFGKGKGAGTSMGSDETPDRKTRANVTWSSDSKSFFITRTDTRGIKDLFLVDSIATPRPKLEQYPYPMPGEENVRKPELYYYNPDKQALVRVAPKWKDERYSDLRWGKSPGELRFIRRDRLQRNLEICSLDVSTGTTKCLLGESFDSAFLDMQAPRYIEETDEMLWWSERSGWGHYYRYGRDGTFKNAITSGNWRVSRIVDVDVKAGYLYLIGNGREPGENIYFTHLYRVKFDGSELTCLDPSLGPTGQPMPGGFNQTSVLSPTKKYVVTSSTRTDYAPFVTVRDHTGKLVMTLETTDLSRLEATGWKMPETFVVKAADGVTDLYGNMWKPFDFDPKKKYPIIVYVYPGPQQEGVTHRFSAYSSYMQLAQLGFIVIQVGHRGGSPERSKAYHTFGYYNLRDYGLIDKKAAIEALAARHSYIDIDRVGIYGHSGGGFMTAAALLQKPYNEFFKAGVASAGNHDNNIYNDNWSERYHGLKEVPIDQKSTTDTGTSDTSGKGKGRGFGGKKGGGYEAEIEAEIDALISALDPDDTVAVQELEKKLQELKARLAALKEAEAQATIAPPPRKAGTEPPPATPATRFEIRVPTNAELAENLKGHLLLVHGEIDNNVHPANTMRLVDALIKANKRFDLLIIPGARHGFGVAQPYFTQKMWDFFAEHLLDDRQTGADINVKEVRRK